MTDLSKATVSELITELRRQRDEINTALVEYGGIANTIAKIVADEYNLKISELNTHTRTPRISFPRQVAMTLIHESGHSFTEAASFFGFNNRAASHAKEVILELELRDKAFAVQMQSLRTQVASAVQEF